MKAPHNFAVFLVWTISAMLVGAFASLELHGVNSLNTAPRDRVTQRAQPGGLPQCGMSCLETLPKDVCDVNNPTCLCNNSDLSATVQACASSTCTVGDGLATQRYQAGTCDVPVRDKSGFYRRFNWAMFIVASLFVIGRFASRTPQLEGSGYSWDDWVALACYVLLIPADVSGEMEVQHGLCRDMYMLTVPAVVTVLKWFYVGEVTYNVIIMGTKTSLVLLYLRIWSSDSVSRTFRPFCWALVALVSATAVVGALVIIFQCTPVSMAWTAITGEVHGHCIKLTPFTYCYAALNIVYDVIVILLPVRELLKLNISLAKKVGICSVFLVGFLVTICSLVRLQYLVKLGDSTNITWDFQYIGMWSLVEANFSVVCCCMPAMAGLARRIWLKCTDPTTPSFSKSTQSAQTYLVGEPNIERALSREDGDPDPEIEMQYKGSAQHDEHLPQR